MDSVVLVRGFVDGRMDVGRSIHFILHLSHPSICMSPCVLVKTVQYKLITTAINSVYINQQAELVGT